MTIGERIKRRREELGITVDEIAKRLGKHRATVYRYEGDEIITLPTDVLELLAIVLQTTPAYLMGWAEKETSTTPPPLSIPGILPPPKTYTVPRLGAIACGEPILADENIEDHDEVPEHIHCHFTLRCEGDSMMGARINDGDIVYIRQQPEVENGEIAAVLIDDAAETARATLKRVYRTANQIILQAENPKYPPMVFAGEEMNQIRILGKAVGFTSLIGK